jgi:eukaryotic-like serine/threonine-protein kinase
LTDEKTPENYFSGDLDKGGGLSPARPVDSQRLTGLHLTSAARANRSPQDTTLFSSTSGESTTFLPGDLIGGDYQLLAMLGRGGMGVVFSCKHLAMDQTYALKLLSGKQLDGEAWGRFQAEAKALARLNHPGIVRIHNMGIHKQQFPYYVMDLLSGQTLDLLIARDGGLSVNRCLNLFIQTADALNSAHANGIVHRDIKPANMMIERQSEKEFVKIVDFGIARIAHQNLASQSQTATGLVFGTPYYMSPEQCLGQRSDRRSDIYSFGCALFEALTGVVPFQGENAFQTFLYHQNRPAPTLEATAPGRSFPAELEKAVAKMLKKDLSERYQSMAQVKHDLERIRDGKPIMEKAINLGDTLEAHPVHRSIKAGAGVESKKLSRAAIAAGATMGLILTAVAVTVLISIKPDSLNKISKLAQIKSPKALPGQKNLPGPASFESPQERKDKDSLGISLFNRFGEAADQDLRQKREDIGAVMQTLAQKIAPEEELRALGFSGADLEATQRFNLGKLGEEAADFKAALRNYYNLRKLSRAQFHTRSGRPGFLFSPLFSLGGISINGAKPVRAIGFVEAPQGCRACIYLETASGEDPGILDQFGPDDLTGLEFRWDKEIPALERALKWRRLDELSFFNSALKAPPGLEQLDECALSADLLKQADKFKNLRSLGLCGQNLEAKDILDRPVLKKLKTLKLKSVGEIDKILNALSAYPNIHELWLVHEGTTTKQLEPLTRMKNLDSLTLRFCPLPPGSLTVFQRMKHLKYLSLDRDWSEAEKRKFKAGLPGCKVVFESVYDHTLWQLLPDNADRKKRYGPATEAIKR